MTGAANDETRKKEEFGPNADCVVAWSTYAARFVRSERVGPDEVALALINPDAPPAAELSTQEAFALLCQVPNVPAVDLTGVGPNSPEVRFLRWVRQRLGDEATAWLVNTPAPVCTTFQKLLHHGSPELLKTVGDLGNVKAKSVDKKEAWQVLKPYVAPRDRSKITPQQLCSASMYRNLGELSAYIARLKRDADEEPDGTPRKRKRRGDAKADAVWGGPKVDAWDWFFRHAVKEALCPCCRRKHIYRNSADECSADAGWHRCHIVSKFKGGPEHVHNLLVACSDCNRMHSEHNALERMHHFRLLRPNLEGVLQLLHRLNAQHDETYQGVVQRLYNPDSCPCGPGVLDAAQRLDAMSTDNANQRIIDALLAAEDRIALLTANRDPLAL